VEELIGGYLRTTVLDAGLVRYLVGPALGDSAGVLGAIAMAEQAAAEADGTR
jgi:hypothetical protein